MFLKYPVILGTDERYAHISNNAKILYIYLYGRTELSLKNKWLDDENKPYIYCSRSEMSSLLNVSKSTACRALKELINAKLVRVGRRVSGASPKLYVTDLLSASYQSLEDGENTNKSYNSDEISELLLRYYG